MGFRCVLSVPTFSQSGPSPPHDGSRTEPKFSRSLMEGNAIFSHLRNDMRDPRPLILKTLRFGGKLHRASGCRSLASCDGATAAPPSASWLLMRSSLPHKISCLGDTNYSSYVPLYVPQIYENENSVFALDQKRLDLQQLRTSTKQQVNLRNLQFCELNLRSNAEFKRSHA